MRPTTLATLRTRGTTSSERSDDSSRKSCMPPILRNGRMTMARPMMPMPPIHCRVERHSRIEGGRASSPESTVEPVVVSPEADLEIGVEQAEAGRCRHQRQRPEQRHHEPRHDGEERRIAEAQLERPALGGQHAGAGEQRGDAGVDGKDLRQPVASGQRDQRHRPLARGDREENPAESENGRPNLWQQTPAPSRLGPFPVVRPRKAPESAGPPEDRGYRL